MARQIVIGFGIAIILPLLIHYGLTTFHPLPKFQDFSSPRPMLPATATADERKDYAEKSKQQQEAFAQAQKQFGLFATLISTPIGIIAILVGAHLSVQAIGTGLILGGIFSICMGYWSFSFFIDDWLRFISLLTAFAALLFVGIKRGSMRQLSQKPAEQSS